VPAEYFLYYYFTDDILAEMQSKGTTRADEILAAVPEYWSHYEEQAAADVPRLDPARSRGGINELELAIDVIDAIFNDRGEVWPVNVPSRGAMSQFPDDLVVEVPGYVDRAGITPLVQPPLPRHLVGLVEMLGEYQAVAAEAAWDGTRADAIRALAANPLVRSVARASRLYDEMAAAQRAYLPARLLAA
jgi:6-phospho-beta-glucosidase